MKAEGAVFLTYKTLFYELVESVDGSRHAEKGAWETFGPLPDDLPEVPPWSEAHSGLMPANLITLFHFSMFSAMNLANSAGVFGGATTAPRSAIRFLMVAIEHHRVGLLVERCDDLGRRALGRADADPAGRLVALEETVDRRHVGQERQPLERRHAERPAAFRP